MGLTGLKLLMLRQLDLTGLTGLMGLKLLMLRL